MTIHIFILDEDQLYFAVDIFRFKIFLSEYLNQIIQHLAFDGTLVRCEILGRLKSSIKIGSNRFTI